jgi:ribonuclease E
MSDDVTPTTSQSNETSLAPKKRTRAKKAATTSVESAAPAAEATETAAPAKRTRARKTASASTPAPELATAPEQGAVPAKKAAAKRTRARKSADAPVEAAGDSAGSTGTTPLFQAPTPLFQAPAAEDAPKPRKRTSKKAAAALETTPAREQVERTSADAQESGAGGDPDSAGGDGAEGADGPKRRRRRGGRGRRGRGKGGAATENESTDSESNESDDNEVADGSDNANSDSPEESDEGGSHRRRRRRRAGSGDAAEVVETDEPNTVVKVRPPRQRRADEPTGIKGSVRIEAKKQRRREGRDAGRRRAPIITEAEFLARRESVERIMVVRDKAGRTQIGVLEDGILVEHHVTQGSSGSLIGNVYLGRVQNVLTSMEAAFIDIGKGRNAVLYAGEVNWDAAGLEGQPRRIELAMKSGDNVLVQVTKDPVGHKGARLTSQISLPGRYLVFVPNGSMTGISRKLPDTERTRLKSVLKRVVPEGAGVIVRTASEGASEEELGRDVSRLSAQWDDIKKKSETGSGATLLYSEPDLTIRVIRDVFNEDFTSLIVSGDDVWDTVEPYVAWVAPDLRDRLSRWTASEDLFTHYRVDEQLTKALDRKVWLPSGGSLVIDRTEAMTVVDVNTGRFTGQGGGNLEETVTKNNLEAAEEIVRQLRLRDIGGIIVVDFIDMVLESNRDLVLRRLLECLGRDRTKHQVAEVTSLGLVQMTRKRMGQGLLEVFSETCDCCNGRGIKINFDGYSANGGSHGGGSPSTGSPNGDAKAPKPQSPSAGEDSAGGAGGKEPKRKRSSRSKGGGKAAPQDSVQDAPADALSEPEPSAETSLV